MSKVKSETIKLRAKKGGIANGRKLRKKAIANYYRDPNICKNCKSIIEIGDNKASYVRTKKFCSKSCAAEYNNKKYPKKIKNGPRQCKKCNGRIKRNKSGHYNKYCQNCRLLLDKIFGNLPIGGKRRSIHSHAVRVMKDVPNICKICGYDKHVHVCHIVPVCKFHDSATFNEVNSKNNLIKLCPNHHWELDHGELSIK